MSKIIFGTDGWRAKMDEEMNEDSVSRVAQAFSGYINNRFVNASVAVAYDGRKNSELFAQLFAGILTGNNIKCYLSDEIIPTPVLSYYVKNNSLSAGVMITASHNPAEYNGVKFKDNYGGPFLTEETLKVEQLLDLSEIKNLKSGFAITDMLDTYLSGIQKLIDFDCISKSKVSVLIDSMSGAGKDILENILRNRLPKVNTIYAEPDIYFSGRSAEPIEKNLTPLSEALKNEAFSCGLATDGDADRLGVMLGDGSWLSAQETILLLADYIINQKGYEGNIVKTSSVTDKIRQFFETEERHVYDVQVGFKYICEKMISDEISFGAEESGGYGYGIHLPERDGLFSALLIVEMLAKSGFTNLSDYVDEKRKKFGHIFYDRIDSEYHKDDRVEILQRLFEKNIKMIINLPVVHADSFLSSRGIINGIKYRLEGNCRWLLLRSSETEPMVRIYAEGNSNEEVQQLLSEGYKLING